MFLLIVAVAVFAVDRITKTLAQRNLPLDKPVPVIDNLVYLTHTQNAGAAFSMGRSFGNFYLVFAILVSLGIVLFYRRLGRGQAWVRLGLGMILGGALGNAFDRLLTQSVTDFVDLRWWPVFNVADSCIVVGTIIVIADGLLRSRQPARADAGPD